jgi:DNA-directed RNA polymerase specialized sigma24 family protein
MAVRLDLMPAKDDGIETGVIARDLLRKLPKDQADALLYVRVLGFSDAEAGTILGISERAVRFKDGVVPK